MEHNNKLLAKTNKKLTNQRQENRKKTLTDRKTQGQQKQRQAVTGRLTDRPTDRQTNRQTDKQLITRYEL